MQRDWYSKQPVRLSKTCVFFSHSFPIAHSCNTNPIYEQIWLHLVIAVSRENLSHFNQALPIRTYFRFLSKDKQMLLRLCSCIPYRYAVVCEVNFKLKAGVSVLNKRMYRYLQKTSHFSPISVSFDTWRNDIPLMQLFKT